MVTQPVSYREADTADGTNDLIGIPYRHEWIPADLIEVDRRYQRKLNAKWVDQLAKSFDPFLLDDLLVNRGPDGRYAVMDGQHRLLAIRAMGWGDQRVPCKVYDNLPESLQAKRFNVQQVRRSLTPQEKFRAALVEGDPIAVSIERSVAASGYRLNLDDGELSGGQIVGVSALRRVATSSRPGDLDVVLGILRDGFGGDVGPRHSVIEGVSMFNGKFRGEYDRPRLIEVMRRMTLSRIAAEGEDISRVIGGSTASGVAYHLWRTYNHRLSDARKLPEFSNSDGRRSRSNQPRGAAQAAQQ
jgi:hypothetical protein